MLALLAAGLVLAACGGTSQVKSTTAASTATALKAEFIAQADAICSQSRAAVSRLVGQSRPLAGLGDTPRAFALAAALSRRVQSLEAGELGRLQALKLPVLDSARATSFFQEGAKAVAHLGQLAGALARRDRNAILAATRVARQNAAASKGLAQGYGFKVCGNAVAGNGLS